MARRRLMPPGVGEHLLTTKLQILNGTYRQSNSALSMLTGTVAIERLVVADLAEMRAQPQAAVCPLHPSRHFSARTIYLSERNLGDVDRIADAWQLMEPRRLSRSAIVRRAVEFLYASVEADQVKSMLENE